MIQVLKKGFNQTKTNTIILEQECIIGSIKVPSVKIKDLGNVYCFEFRVGNVLVKPNSKSKLGKEEKTEIKTLHLSRFPKVATPIKIPPQEHISKNIKSKVKNI